MLRGLRARVGAFGKRSFQSPVWSRLHETASAPFPAYPSLCRHCTSGSSPLSSPSSAEGSVAGGSETANVSALLDQFLEGQLTSHALRSRLIHQRSKLSTESLQEYIASLPSLQSFQALPWDSVHELMSILSDCEAKAAATALLQELKQQAPGSFGLPSSFPVEETTEFKVASAVFTASSDVDAALLTLDELGVLPPYWRSYVKPLAESGKEEEESEGAKKNIPFAGEALAACIAAKHAQGNIAEAIALFRVAVAQKYKLSREAFPPLFECVKVKVEQDLELAGGKKKAQPQSPISREVQETLVEVWQAAVRWDALYRYHHADQITKLLASLPPSLLEQLIAAVEAVNPDLQLRAFNVLLNTFGKVLVSRLAAVTFACFIRCFLQMSHFRGASRVWRQMRHRTLTPDAAACNSVSFNSFLPHVSI